MWKEEIVRKNGLTLPSRFRDRYVYEWQTVREFLKLFTFLSMIIIDILGKLKSKLFMVLTQYLLTNTNTKNCELTKYYDEYFFSQL
jgi:hypothetical protein